MELLVINNIDFTKHIKVPSWKVNKEDVYEEWTDGNYKKHREVTRQQIKGDFTLLFDEVDDLNQFFSTINALKVQHPDGYIPVRVYINNYNIQEDIYAVLEYTPSNEKPYFGRQNVSGFTVKLEEQ